MVFPCNQCGWCCQNLQNSEIYHSLDDGTGVCKFFDKEMKICTIYDHRPQICNINAMYHSSFSFMRYEEYIELNIKACQTAQKQNNLPIIQI